MRLRGRERLRVETVRFESIVQASLAHVFPDTAYNAGATLGQTVLVQTNEYMHRSYDVTCECKQMDLLMYGTLQEDELSTTELFRFNPHHLHGLDLPDLANRIRTLIHIIACPMQAHQLCQGSRQQWNTSELDQPSST
eukprot:3893528-Rhodomonas_salina.2